MKRLVMVVVILAAYMPAGAQWVQSSLGDAQVGYNLYSDASGVWAATLNGVYYTADLGNPWFSQGLTGRLVFDVIRCGNVTLAATEGAGPGVFRTTDNGAHWLDAVGMTNRSVRAFAKNSSFVFACTWGGGVYRSADSGATWQSVGLTNRVFRSIHAIGEQIFVGGDSVFFSVNNGLTWTARALPWPAADTWCFASFNGAIYAGDMGLYKSTDMGLSWKLVYGMTFDSAGMPVDSKLVHDLAVSGGALVCAMNPGGIMISTDGERWRSWIEGGLQDDWVFAALAVRPPHIWALRSFFGNAYYRPLGELTGTGTPEMPIPASYALDQNYPNPFNPSTSIRYTIPVRTHVTLAIYNVVGEAVAVPVDEWKEAGVYAVAWNPASLASGTYVARMQAGPYVRSVKLLLVR